MPSPRRSSLRGDGDRDALTLMRSPTGEPRRRVGVVWKDMVTGAAPKSNRWAERYWGHAKNPKPRSRIHRGRNPRRSRTARKPPGPGGAALQGESFPGEPEPRGDCTVDKIVPRDKLNVIQIPDTEFDLVSRI